MAVKTVEDATLYLKNYEIDVPNTMKNQTNIEWNNKGEWIDEHKKKRYHHYLAFN